MAPKATFDTDTVIIDLLAAAALLRRDGWTQRSLEVTKEMLSASNIVTAAPNGYVIGELGSRCSLGAICAVTEHSMSGWRTVAAIRALIDEANLREDGSLFSYPDELVNWNDAVGRTAEEVITAFEQAAANLKAKRDDKLKNQNEATDLRNGGDLR